MTSNGNPVGESRKDQMSLVIFFIIHYGFFHLGYLTFLATDAPITDLPQPVIAGMIMTMAVFAGMHVYSFRHNRLLDFRDKKPNIGILMFYPYMRIIPMHLIIVFGLAGEGNSFGMLVFMLMKTVADAGMHAVEHRIFQRSATSPMMMKD